MSKLKKVIMAIMAVIAFLVMGLNLNEASESSTFNLILQNKI